MRYLILLLLIGLYGCGGGPSDTLPTTAVIQPIPPPQITIVTIGDSETAGAVSVGDTFINVPTKSYPAVLQSLSPYKHNVINLGINSSNILEAYAEQFPQAKNINSNILIISTTLNDAGDSLSYQAIKSTIDSIQAQLPNTKIYLLTPLRNDAIADLYLYRQNVWQMGYEVIDVYSQSNGSWYCGNTDIHPCEYGYSEMAKIIYERIK